MPPPNMETPPPAERSDSATIAGAIDTQKHTASADLPRGLHWGIATFARGARPVHPWRPRPTESLTQRYWWFQQHTVANTRFDIAEALNSKRWQRR
jgi:hypothetical protein